MEVIFRTDFLKTLTILEQSTRLKINLYSPRIRFKFENWPMGTLIHFSLKNCSRTCVQKCRFLGERAIIFSLTMKNNTPVKLNNAHC